MSAPALVRPSLVRPSVRPQGYLLLSCSGSSTFFLDYRPFIASQHMSSQRNTFNVCKQELDEKKFQGLLKFGCQNNFLNSVISNLRRICPLTCLSYIWSVNLDLFKRVTEIIIIHSNRSYLSKNTARFFFNVYSNFCQLIICKAQILVLFSHTLSFCVQVSFQRQISLYQFQS